MFSLALAAWAVIALLGALWGGAQTLIGTAPSALEAAKQLVAQHAGALSTAAKEQLAQTVDQASQVGTQMVASATALAAAAGIALKELPVLPAEAIPARDVSGEDLGPARFQGLARVAWSNTEKGASVRYEDALTMPMCLSTTSASLARSATSKAYLAPRRSRKRCASARAVTC